MTPGNNINKLQIRIRKEVRILKISRFSLTYAIWFFPEIIHILDERDTIEFSVLLKLCLKTLWIYSSFEEAITKLGTHIGSHYSLEIMEIIKKMENQGNTIF